jgi:DNA-binding LacI/PurR family transcriptional regulator
MKELLDHLSSQKYTNFIMLSSLKKPLPNYFTQEMECFKDFLNDNGFKGNILLEKDDKAKLLKEIDKEVKDAASETVFIADSRYLTIKLLELFYAHGKNMPNDAGMVGNNLIANFTEPKLTTRKISFYDLGGATVDMMNKLWSNNNKPMGNWELDSQIIINDSTRKN